MHAHTIEVPTADAEGYKCFRFCRSPPVTAVDVGAPLPLLRWCSSRSPCCETPGDHARTHAHAIVVPPQSRAILWHRSRISGFWLVLSSAIRRRGDPVFAKGGGRGQYIPTCSENFEEPTGYIGRRCQKTQRAMIARFKLERKRRKQGLSEKSPAMEKVSG